MDRFQLDEALRIARECRETDIGKVLVQLGVVGDREILQAKAQEMGYAFVDLDRIQIEQSTIDLITAKLANDIQTIPVKKQDNTLYIALTNPNDLRALDSISLTTGCRVVPVIAVREAIEQALQRYYPIPTPEETEGR